jgi:serine/threonine-protein kinase HipA
MRRCPITYEEIPDDQFYSSAGLHLLDPKLSHLEVLPLSASEQREEALKRAGKMSVQGLQLKLSAVLKVKEGKFEIVDCGGRYLLKPPSLIFKELPENEDLTMRLAKIAGINVPLHGLLWGSDGSMTYFIKRFDRKGYKRIPLEDFAQLSGHSRDTKYQSSMEKVAKVIEDFATFAPLERVELFRRTLFSFLVGNEDMHLKNFSLITQGNKTTLSPAYDFVNSTLALLNAKEELALPISGKKSNLSKKDLITYFGIERLGLNSKIIQKVTAEFKLALEKWPSIIDRSFLSEEAKSQYLELIVARSRRLQLSEGVLGAKPTPALETP